MKRKGYILKVLVIGMICLLTVPSIQGAFGGISSSESIILDEEDNIEPRDTTHYTNCRILVTGKCDTVTGPLGWILGFYCPLFKKNFLIRANGGEDEVLTVLIFGSGQFGTFLDKEYILLDIRIASGILYYFGKSVIVQGNRIFAFCNAQDIFVTI